MTIANALASLPTDQKEYVTLLVSQHVRVKSNMVKSGHTDSVIMKRCVSAVCAEYVYLYYVIFILNIGLSLTLLLKREVLVITQKQYSWKKN